MSRINQVDLYRKPNFFNYLTDDEAKVVMELLRDIKHARVPMDTSSSANPDAASGSATQQVDGGPQGGEQPLLQAADESIKSGRQMVLEALGALYSTTEEANLCLYCGSTDEHFDCKNPGKNVIKNALNVIRGCMQEEPTEAEADKSTDGHSGSGQNVDADANEEEVSDEEDDPAEGQMYDKFIYMSEVGDRDVLGTFCIAGRKVDEGGPTIRGQIDEVVREALMRGTGDRRTVAEFFRNCSDINRGRRMYEEIKHYMDGFFKIISTNHSTFHFGLYGFYGVDYGRDYVPRLDPL